MSSEKEGSNEPFNLEIIDFGIDCMDMV